METAHVIHTELSGFVRVPDIPYFHGSPDIVPGVEVHVLHWDLLIRGVRPVYDVFLIHSERDSDFQTIILQFESEKLNKLQYNK